MSGSRFKVRVLWSNGDIEYAAGPNGDVAVFMNRDAANEIADGFRAGIDPDQVESISVIKVRKRNRNRKPQP